MPKLPKISSDVKTIAKAVTIHIVVPVVAVVAAQAIVKKLEQENAN